MSIANKTRELVKTIPGSRKLYRSLIETPGSWIFTKNNTAWLSEENNYKQLPYLYRVFSTYCRLAPTIKNRIFGAEQLHLVLSALTRLSNARNYSPINTGKHIVYLSITDPRSLLVPNELMKGSEIATLSDFLSSGDIFIDIGSNHGSFSISAAKLIGPKGRIIAIEPQPRLAFLINKSLSENAASPFDIHQVACSDHNGVSEFYIPRATSGSAGIFKSFSATSSTEKITVTLTKFDDLVDVESFPESGNVFIKLDIEGSEILFLKGAEQSIKATRPHIMMEINPYAMKAANTSISDLIINLRELGYSIYKDLNDSRIYELKNLTDTTHKNIIVLPAMSADQSN